MEQTWETPQMAQGARVAWSRIVIYGLLGFFALIYLLPQDWTIEPWVDAWQRACVGLTCNRIKGYFWNSIKMTVAAVIISTAIGLLNGYVLTKWKFRGANLLFGLMLFG